MESMTEGLIKAFPSALLLHIGGKEKVRGWTVLDALPGPHVDIVGDCQDLSMLADGSCGAIYSSHVLEHLGYDEALPAALKGFFRVLAPGGVLLTSVPDLDTLCRLFVRPDLSADEKYLVMRMMYGGRVTDHDIHYTGFNFDFLNAYLVQAGFTDIRRVASLGCFRDTSEMLFRSVPISLNMVARKPA